MDMVQRWHPLHVVVGFVVVANWKMEIWKMEEPILVE